MIIFVLIISILISGYCLYRSYTFKKIPGNYGPPGIQGKKGPPGYIGNKGFTGKIGPKGYTGLPGDFGGIRGYSGIRGKRGDRGQNGPRGYEGLKGFRGERGLPGERGLQGPKGPTGFRGPMGTIAPYDFTKIDYDNCDIVNYDTTYEEVQCINDKLLVELIKTDIGFNAKCCPMKLNDKCLLKQKNVKSIKINPDTGKEMKEWNWVCPSGYYKVFKGSNKDINRYCCKRD